MNGLAAVLTVFLSMPGVPAKEHRETVPSIEICVAAALAAQKEISEYAILENIPATAVKFKATCTKTFQASN